MDNFQSANIDLLKGISKENEIQFSPILKMGGIKLLKEEISRFLALRDLNLRRKNTNKTRDKNISRFRNLRSYHILFHAFLRLLFPPERL